MPSPMCHFHLLRSYLIQPSPAFPSRLSTDLLADLSDSYLRNAHPPVRAHLRRLFPACRYRHDTKSPASTFYFDRCNGHPSSNTPVDPQAIPPCLSLIMTHNPDAICGQPVCVRRCHFLSTSTPPQPTHTERHQLHPRNHGERLQYTRQTHREVLLRRKREIQRPGQHRHHPLRRRRHPPLIGGEETTQTHTVIAIIV